jgi:hypothetical protein
MKLSREEVIEAMDTKEKLNLVMRLVVDDVYDNGGNGCAKPYLAHGAIKVVGDEVAFDIDKFMEVLEAEMLRKLCEMEKVASC